MYHPHTGGLRKAPQRSREEDIVLVLSPAVLVLESTSEAKSVIINIHGLLFRLYPMVPFECMYEYEHDETAEPDGYSPAELVVYEK